MTRDSGRHAQRGDAKQAPSEGCQSVIAQRIPTSSPIGTDKELIVRLRKYGHIEAADALLSRIAEVERLTAEVAFLKSHISALQNPRAALSLHGKV